MILSSLVFFGGCAMFPAPGSQNQVARTQQGIEVGLKIYDSSQTSEIPPVNGSGVTVMSPDLTQPLKSPVTIHGKVGGAFFSEGVFPVVLLDAKGNEIARSLAHADGEWMTEAAVPFTVELAFDVSGTEAQLVFRNDNPSGLPENDRSQSFAVTLQ